MIVRACHSCQFEKEGGASRETPNRGSHRCHHLLFDVCRSGLESVVIH
jgi:hypothetical protein